jgi:hypothetical protein
MEMPMFQNGPALYHVNLIERSAQSSGQLLRIVVGPKVHEKEGQIACGESFRDWPDRIRLLTQ